MGRFRQLRCLGLLAAAALCCGLGWPMEAKAAAATTGGLAVTNHTTGLPGVTLPDHSITTTCTPHPLVSPYQAVWLHSANDGVGGSIPAPNSCTVTAAPLAPIYHVQACNGGSASWTTTITPAQPVSVVVSVSGDTNNPSPITYVSVVNTLSCDHASGGHLSLRKIVVNPMGAPIPATFSLTAHCTGAPFLPPVSLAAGQGLSLAAVIPANSSCSVTEPNLAPITNVAGCGGGSASWTTSYMPATVTVAANANPTITVTNSLKCDPPPPKGGLRVLKSIINATGMPVVPMPATFAMKVDCVNSGPHQNISVPVGTVGTTIANITAPSQCSVAELPLASIAHVEGCHGGTASWTTVVTPTQPVAIVANTTTTVTFRNTLTCDKR